MSYRAFWSPTAERELEALLNSSRFQNDLAQAVRDIDLQLVSAPIGFGASRYDEMRIGFSRPLGVEYEVFADVRTVIVHGV
jgi:hypothetical protein